ncbi:MAG: hypothetical protein K1X67_20900 [Fimbriimonadaceae bacterium]|nr:hypothetical protein [Fimbriimonadaceae bacterium]
MSGSRVDTLQQVLSRCEESLTVELIATKQPHTCSPEQRESDVYDDCALKNFDNIPVVEAERVIGLWQRPAAADNRSVRDAMVPLPQVLVVSSDLSIDGLLAVLRERQGSAALVLYGHTHHGIVTHSDLVKLPVRITLFARISHLESILGDIIRSRVSTNWQEMLRPDASKHVEGTWKRLIQRRADADKLDATNLDHRFDIVSKLLRDSDPGLADCLTESRDDAYGLRNDVAHGNEYAERAADLTALLTTVGTIERLIADLTALEATPTP